MADPNLTEEQKKREKVRLLIALLIQFKFFIASSIAMTKYVSCIDCL